VKERTVPVYRAKAPTIYYAPVWVSASFVTQCAWRPRGICSRRLTCPQPYQSIGRKFGCNVRVSVGCFESAACCRCKAANLAGGMRRQLLCGLTSL
jgi:hypothetical protein